MLDIIIICLLAVITALVAMLFLKKAEVRTRAMQRKLQDVEEQPEIEGNIARESRELERPTSVFAKAAPGQVER